MSKFAPPAIGTSLTDLLTEFFGAEAFQGKWLVKSLADGLQHWPLTRHRTDYDVYDIDAERTLTITCYYPLAKGMGERPFDIPLLGRGRLPNVPDERELVYFVQAKSEGPVSQAQFDHFFQELAQQGYRFVDPRPEHLGIFRGQVVLLAPWVVCSPRPVSEILRETTDKVLLYEHEIESYAVAFEHSPLMATRMVLRNARVVILELAGGGFLNITEWMRLKDEMGTRSFDVPMLERGSLPNSFGGYDIEYFIHPPVKTPVSREQREEFRAVVNAESYRFEGNETDIGIYEGRLVLLDPWQVFRSFAR